eukprot:6598404-Prymnesium_polylepis.1
MAVRPTARPTAAGRLRPGSRSCWTRCGWMRSLRRCLPPTRRRRQSCWADASTSALSTARTSGCARHAATAPRAGCA